MKMCEDVTVIHNIYSSVYIGFVCFLYDFTRLLDLIVPLPHIYRVAQKMYTLFTHQYLWNKFK